jgi:MOSC domain-containing protein YiiM
MDEIRQGLQEAIRGRRGLLCRVVVSGRIRCGDPIEVEENLHAARHGSDDSLSGAY